MRDRTFMKRLSQELPVWVEKGWVRPGADQEILKYTAAQHGGGDRHVIALSLMGVILLGAGVITFFAAHWSGMSKLAKLLVLFGGMSAAYIAAAITAIRGNLPRISESLWLLGVLLFGANIMLIAQIYNIDSHYPDGVLMWALGGLLVAYAASAQMAMAGAIALAVLWSGMEILDFESTHWGFLLFWATCLPAIYRKAWLPALQLAMIGLLFWSTFIFASLSRNYGNALYLMQIYFLAYLSLFVGGMLLATQERTQGLAPIVKHYAAVAAALAFFALTFPGLQRSSPVWAGISSNLLSDAAWLGITLAAASLLAGLAIWHRRASPVAEHAAHLKWGRLLLAIIGVLLTASLLLHGEHDGMMALLFNLAFFGSVVWLMFHAVHFGDKFLLNLAFLLFSIWLLSRYFDTFWTLFDRSFFFMAGGALLLAGGYVLEKQRRKLKQIIAAHQEGK